MPENRRRRSGMAGIMRLECPIRTYPEGLKGLSLGFLTQVKSQQSPALTRRIKIVLVLVLEKRGWVGELSVVLRQVRIAPA